MFWNQCYLRCSGGTSFIMKYKTVEKKIRGRFNTQTTTTDWTSTVLVIVLEFDLTLGGVV